MSDDFANLRAIASVNNKKVFWKFNERGDLMGTIVGFGQFDNPQYGGIQYTIEVQLADTGEIASAFLNGYLRQSMDIHQADVGDKVLIQYLGREPNQRFNRYSVHIEKLKNEPYPNFTTKSF